MKALLLGSSTIKHTVSVEVGIGAASVLRFVGWTAVDTTYFGPIGNNDQIPYWAYVLPNYPSCGIFLVGCYETWRVILDEDGQITNEIDPNGFGGSTLPFQKDNPKTSPAIYDLSIDVDGINRVNHLDVGVYTDVQQYDIPNPLGFYGKQKVELTFRPSYSSVRRK